MKGLVFIVIGFILAATANMFKRVPNQATTIGTVVSCKYTGDDHYEGIVEYDVGLKAYHVKKGYGCYSVGQKEKVAYNTENPEEAFIAATPGQHIVVACCFALGLAMMYSIIVLGDETIFGIMS